MECERTEDKVREILLNTTRLSKFKRKIAKLYQKSEDGSFVSFCAEFSGYPQSPLVVVLMDSDSDAMLYEVWCETTANMIMYGEVDKDFLDTLRTDINVSERRED